MSVLQFLHDDLIMAILGCLLSSRGAGSAHHVKFALRMAVTKGPTHNEQNQVHDAQLIKSYGSIYVLLYSGGIQPHTVATGSAAFLCQPVCTSHFRWTHFTFGCTWLLCFSNFSNQRNTRLRFGAHNDHFILSKVVGDFREERGGIVLGQTTEKPSHDWPKNRSNTEEFQFSVPPDVRHSLGGINISK